MRGAELTGKRGVEKRFVLLLSIAVIGMALMAVGQASARIVLKTSWGGRGSGAGQLNGGGGVVADSVHHVYVGDAGNNRIDKFTAGGRSLLAWGWGVKDLKPRLERCWRICHLGLGGTGRGQMDGPNGLAIDPGGRLLVADSGNDRIERFSRSGRILDQWGSRGAGRSQFHDPFDVTTDAAGHVYVADFFHQRIKKFSADGRFLRQWPASYPFALEAGPTGSIYVAEYYSDRVDKFSPNGRLRVAWGWGVKNGDSEFQRCRPPGACGAGIEGDGDGEFAGPKGVATDAKGNVYVADTYNGRIQKFSPSGRYLTKWATRKLPQSVATDSGRHVYVVNDSSQVLKYAQPPPRRGR
jgi:DNA-binding beta-propeller fold protein YncE